MESNPNIDSLKDLQTFISLQSNTRNVTYISKIPDVCKTYPCILGIDEAGRGPVLGPMVYGISFCPINEQTILEKLECADSKALNEKKRDIIFSNICKESKTLGWAVEIIAPMSICNSMLSRKKYSLNQVSMDSAVGLVKAAESAGVKIEHIFVDTVGPSEKYQDYLRNIFPKYKITVAKKADSLFPIVSAASICAKVTRDHSLKVWIFPEEIDVNQEQFGSGYPADPVTKQFLMDHCEPIFGYPQLVRFSWSTSEQALKERAYHVEGGIIDDIGKKSIPANSTSITSFFKVNNDKQVEKTRHEFFIQRCLSRNVEF